MLIVLAVLIGPVAAITASTGLALAAVAGRDRGAGAVPRRRAKPAAAFRNDRPAALIEDGIAIGEARPLVCCPA